MFINSKLKQTLDKFKSWIEAPRLYIVEELDTIKNEIDIFAERFLMRASKSSTKSDEQKTKDHETVNSNRRQMIDQVEAFEKKLLANMPTNELDGELAKKLTFYIEELCKKQQSFEEKLAKNSNYNMQKEFSELEYVMDSAIYEFDCALKQKSSLLFLNVFLLKKLLNFDAKFGENNFFIEYRSEKAKKFGTKQPELEIKRDENDRDEDEIEYVYPNAYAQLDAATMFGVLFVLDDCVYKEEFV